MYLLPRIPRVLEDAPPLAAVTPGLFSMLAVVTLSFCDGHSRRRRRRGDKMKRDVVVKRLTFSRRGPHSSGRANLLRWLCPIVISFAPLKSQTGVFADPGI